jgi:homoserine acetyltransferase
MGSAGAGMGRMISMMLFLRHQERQRHAQLILGRQALEAQERARIKQMRRYTYDDPFVPPTCAATSEGDE